MWLTRLALRNPILILMLSLMMIVLGLQALGRLSVDLFPNITIPVVRVVTFYTGASPEAIEKAITVPIERAVAAAPGVERVESTSKQGTSIVSAWFGYDTNLDNAQFEVQQRVAQILNTLPPGVTQPYVLQFDITNIPIVNVNVASDALDERQLYDLAYNVIEPQLERLPGVATATPGGGKQREILVDVQPGALRSRSLTVLDVVRAVRSSNLILPSGNLRAGDRDYNIFTNTQIAVPKALEDIVVAPGDVLGSQNNSSEPRQPVRIADLAEVRDGSAEQANIVRVNGVRGVYLRILKQPKANTIAVVDAVRHALPNLRGVPPSVQLAISFDQSAYIRAAVSALEHEAIQGGALAILVILIFLLSLRATAIIAVAIPLSIVATFILLYFSGQTLNVFTLGGLALGVGRLVDDSIVELENIHRHLAVNRSRTQAVLDAAQEVAMPILVSTITTIIVFFPVLFLTGVARSLFIPLAMTISFALVMSFFVSRTVTPLLCLRLLQAQGHGEGSSGRTGHRSWIRHIAEFLDGMDAAYARALTWVLRHRALTIVGILALCGACVPLYFRIGSEFFPSSDESQISITLRTPIGSRIERTEQVAERVEDIVRKNLARGGGSILRTLTADLGLPGGRTALFTGNTGPHSGGIQINLVPRSERSVSDVATTDALRAALREGVPGVQAFFFTGGIVKRILNFGAPAPIDVEILGYDLEAGAEYARALRTRLQQLKDSRGRNVLTDVQITREENYPQLDIVVDRQKAGVSGVTVEQVAQTVLASLSGSSQFSPVRFLDQKSGNEYPINVRINESGRSETSDLNDIYLRGSGGPAGSLIALGSIARIERNAGPVLIPRKYLQRIVDVTANVAGSSSLGEAAGAVKRALSDVPPPDGFSVRVAGQAEAQEQAFSGLTWAALLAVVLVYMVLASQFKSLLSPLIILCSVPLGLAGVLLMLWGTGTTLSVNSFMGIIMMVGIVVSNGVLLVDYANVLRRRGHGLEAATVEAGRTRLRPILMTTVATVVGLLPMALGIGEGSETNLPLARAVIGGLSVSTFFTLFFIPALYSLLGRHTYVGSDDDDDLGSRSQPLVQPV